MLYEVITHPKAPPITLWDFSGYNTVTTEPVPPLEDRQATMQYYWETSRITSYNVCYTKLSRFFDLAGARPV